MKKDKLEITGMSIIDKATHDDIKQLEKDAHNSFIKGLITGILMTTSFVLLLVSIFY